MAKCVNQYSKHKDLSYYLIKLSVKYTLYSNHELIKTPELSFIVVITCILDARHHLVIVGCQQAIYSLEKCLRKDHALIYKQKTL